MREPDLTKLAKSLTSKQLACTEEIKMLMDCMMVRGGADEGGGVMRGGGDGKEGCERWGRKPASQTTLAAMLTRPGGGGGVNKAGHDARAKNKLVMDCVLAGEGGGAERSFGGTGKGGMMDCLLC